MKPVLRKNGRPPLVGMVGPAIKVLTTIKLDYEPGFNAREVGEERSDGVLPAKLVAREPSIAQARPEQALGVGGGFA